MKGNEEVYLLAKQSLKTQTVGLQIALSKAEAKAIIKVHTQNIWQEYWNINDTGRHLYNIQSTVGVGREMGQNQREDALITRIRIRHTGLSKTLKLIGTDTNGLCSHCNQPESAQQVIMDCHTYENEGIKGINGWEKMPPLVQINFLLIFFILDL